jgi:hypothetical protein
LFKSWSLGVRRGHNKENHIYICIYRKKIFFSIASKPISIKFGTNYPWVNRIKDCSKEEPGSFPRRDNHRNAKIGWDHFDH